MYEKISTGETIHFSVTITDADGKSTNPAGLEFHLKRPDNVIQSYVYGTDSNLELHSTGKYSIDLTLLTAGTYYYKWKTTAPNTSIKEGSIRVEAVAF